MKKRMPSNLHNPNDEHKCCWVPTDSNGNILRKEVIHLKENHPKDGRTWVLISCVH